MLGFWKRELRDDVGRLVAYAIPLNDVNTDNFILANRTVPQLIDFRVIENCLGVPSITIAAQPNANET